MTDPQQGRHRFVCIMAPPESQLELKETYTTRQIAEYFELNAAECDLRATGHDTLRVEHHGFVVLL